MKRIKYITEASFSFALIIAANSMAEWHPFVPNAESGLPHLLMELISPLTYCLTWILCMFIGFFAPASAKGPVAFGALGLIYANMAIVLFRQCGFEISIEANVAGTIANNIGAPLLYLLWEQYFASEDDDQCIADILVGRGLPVLLFALLGLISSSSQTMGLRAVILLVAAVALTRCYRSMDWSAPMYAERPLDHRRTYLNVMVLSWKSALCIGSLAFLYTVLRSAFTSSNSTLNGKRPLDHRRTYLNVMVLSWKSALCIGSLAFLYTVLRSAFTSSNSTLNGILTYAPLLGMLAASLAIMALWQRRSFSFNVIQVFRSLFPFLLCLFAAIPLFATALPQITYGIAYGIFSLLVSIGMVQCCQTCKRDGVSPLFMFGFYFGIVNVIQLLGYGFSSILKTYAFFGQSHGFVIALSAMFVTSLVFYLVRGDLDSKTTAFTNAEFIALSHVPDSDSCLIVSTNSRDASSNPYWDRLAKQCANTAARFRLTAREAEVLELLARGNTVPAIAESLVISTGTVQTHCKRLYAKMGIHKKQELIDIVRSSTDYVKDRSPQKPPKPR